MAVSIFVVKEYMKDLFISEALPVPGWRIGTVHETGGAPERNSGIVICHVEDDVGNFALVLMDHGHVETCHGLGFGMGVGWRAVNPQGSN